MCVTAHATGVVKVYVHKDFRPDIVKYLNHSQHDDHRSRFLFYGDTKFNLLKKPSTCSRDDFMAALRSASVETVRVQCYGQKGSCVNTHTAHGCLQRARSRHDATVSAACSVTPPYVCICSVLGHATICVCPFTQLQRAI